MAAGFVMLSSACVVCAFCCMGTFSMMLTFSVGSISMRAFGSVLLFLRGFRSGFTMLSAGYELRAFHSGVVASTMLLVRVRHSEEQPQSQQHNTYRQKDK